MIKQIIAISFLLLFTFCVDFGEFDRIEEDKLRVIGICFEPVAEVAPGDTVIGKAYFAGNEVTAIGGFSVAYTFKWDQNPYFPDERPIELVDSTLWLPDSIQFSFRIPDDVFVKENSLGDIDTNEIKPLIELIKLNKQTDGAVLASMSEDSLFYFFEMISELSTRCFLFFTAVSENNTNLKIRSDFIIRYNSMFPEFMPVNNNPQIQWIGVYKVTGKEIEDFSPMNPKYKGKYSLSYLYNEFHPDSIIDTIEIDTGYTYYIASDRGINTYIDSTGQKITDTTLDFFEIEIGDSVIILPEIYEYEWFYQNLDDVSTEPDSLLDLSSDEESWPSLAQMILPLDTEMKRFRVWLIVYDSFEEEWARPSGFAMRTVDGVFEFTKAYKKSVGNIK